MREYYSKKCNLILYQCPKCGTKSMERILNMRLQDFEPNENTKVLFVYRNPIDRFISSYLHLRRYTRNFERFKTRDISIELYNELFKKDPLEGFEKYILEILKNGFFDQHHMPQTYFLNEHNGRLKEKVDYIWNLDDLTNNTKKYFKINMCHIHSSQIPRDEYK